MDNHGYTPLAIRDEGTTVKVRGPNRQGMVEMRTYDEGSQSPPYVVTDGTDTITMRAADPSATDMSQLEAVGSNTTPGTFLINTFIYEEKDILETINRLESEIGDVINQKSAEFVDPTTVEPPSSYDESRPLTENPQTEGFSAEVESAPASEALQILEPLADNPPAELTARQMLCMTQVVKKVATPQDTFGNAAEDEIGHVNPMKTDKDQSLLHSNAWYKARSSSGCSCYI